MIYWLGSLTVLQLALSAINGRADLVVSPCDALVCDLDQAMEAMGDMATFSMSNIRPPKHMRRRRLADLVLDFEGIGNFVPVDDFYSSSGVFFSSNALALIDADSGGTGNFGGEPSPDAVLFFLSGAQTFMNVPAGFTTGFSLWYSAVNSPGLISVHAGLDGTGAVLAVLPLPLTPDTGAPDPTGSFSPFLPVEVAFAGVALSVSFTGTENQIAFDNIQLGLRSDDVVPPQEFFD